MHVARGELALAIRETERRGAVLAGVALDASTAYHFNDYLLMASEVHLAAGHLHEAADYAERLAELACYRDYPHPAIARRLEVDALAGDFDAAVGGGERFLVAWERAGRPVSGTLNVTAYADGDGARTARRRDRSHAYWIDATLNLDVGSWLGWLGCTPPGRRPSTRWSRSTADKPMSPSRAWAADIDDATMWSRSSTGPRGGAPVRRRGGPRPRC